MNENLPKLIDGICEAYDNLEWKADQNGTTYCNFAMDHIARKCGYNGLSVAVEVRPLLANDQIDLMLSSDEWLKVDEAIKAQSYANAGALVIAGLKLPVHGHVAVLRPGKVEHSGLWRGKAPKGMSVGSFKATFIGKKLSWAFREPPKYFVLKATINDEPV